MNHHFVIVYHIHCESSYEDRFVQLFSTRAHAIDRLPGPEGFAGT